MFPGIGVLRPYRLSVEIRRVSYFEAQNQHGSESERYHPSQCRAPWAGHRLLKALMQPLPETQGNFDHSLIAVKGDDIFRARNHGSATLTAVNVDVHGHTQFGI